MPPCSGSVMNSGAIDATIGRHDTGVATVTRPAPERRAAIAARCAAPVLPREPGDDRDAAEVPLVRIGRARLDELAHLLRREQLDARPFERLDHLVRDADVGDDDVAGVAPPPAAAPAAAWARPA